MDTQERIERIKWLLDNDVPVYAGNTGYHCIKDSKGEYLIVCIANYYCYGLFGHNDETVNATCLFFFNERNEKIYI